MVLATHPVLEVLDTPLVELVALDTHLALVVLATLLVELVVLASPLVLVVPLAVSLLTALLTVEDPVSLLANQTMLQVLAWALLALVVPLVDFK